MDDRAEAPVLPVRAMRSEQQARPAEPWHSPQPKPLSSARRTLGTLHPTTDLMSRDGGALASVRSAPSATRRSPHLFGLEPDAVTGVIFMRRAPPQTGRSWRLLRAPAPLDGHLYVAQLLAMILMSMRRARCLLPTSVGEHAFALHWGNKRWHSYFEDLNLGAVYTTRARTITETDLVIYSGLSGQLQLLTYG